MSETLQPIVSQTAVPGNVYNPSEVIAMFNGWLAQQNIHTKLVYLRGIYLKNPKPDARWSFCYDTLRDENTQDELTLKITQQQRSELAQGNLVSVGGVLTRQITAKGYIQLVLQVSRIDVVKEQVVDETEIRRMELRQKKALSGFRNVDAVLEQQLFVGERPARALVYATVSITNSDFEAGSKAAQAAMDFTEFRVNFASSEELSSLLMDLDGKGFSAIAIVRGGGGGLEHLDDLKVLETIVSLHTPVIAAVGHVEEKIFLKQVVDKVSPTPNGLGAYFSDMVETVSQKKSKSVAVLTEQIRKQFQQQIETASKQNRELQTQLGQLTKASEESQKQHKLQIEEANKQNKTLQERMEEMTKTMKSSEKNHTEQMTALQNQIKTQNELAEKARKEQQETDERKTRQFNESLTRMQSTLDKAASENMLMQKRNAELQSQLSQALSGGRTPVWAIAALVICIIVIIILLLK